MKRYVPIVIGVVALCAVLYVANSQMRERRALEAEEQLATNVTTFTHKVIRSFEGDNILEYGFDLPEGATTTVEKDSALVKVTDASSSPVLAMYFSFEGGRGYSPVEYITNNIIPKVPGVMLVGTTTLGSYEWQVAESERSVWHVARSDNGQWLLVVENRKDVAEVAEGVIKTVITK